MTPVSTVSGGTSGTYEPYGIATRPYGTDSTGLGGLGGYHVEYAKPYGGTGGYERRCPRNAPERTSANLGRRARRRALCGLAAVLAGEGVAR